MDITHPHNIATHALEKNDKIFLVSMLDITQKNLDIYWTLNEESPHITLVNVDAPEGKAYWLANHTKNNLIALAQYNFLKADFFLEKPIRVQKLIDLLKRISIEVPHLFLQNDNRMIKNEVNIDDRETLLGLNNTEFKKEIFEPSLYLTGLLINAVQSKTAQRFSLANSSLYILPKDGNCLTENIDFSKINYEQKLYYQSHAKEINKEVLSTDAIATITQKPGLQKYPIDSFLWASTLYASRGRLLAGYSEKSYVQLKRWPDFSILAHDLEHFRIAAFMQKNPITIETVALKTGLPIEPVINFFNASVITNIIDIKSNYQDKSQQETKPEGTKITEKKSLFKSVLERLMG
jgi:hypothetical protein